MDKFRKSTSVKPKRQYVHRVTRETYELEIDESDLYGRTHKLHNSQHHWEGDKSAFEKEFERL
jgi:hypothetical protein